MIVEQSMHPGWLSNTWLVADEPGGQAVLIDTGGPPAPILQRIEELKLTVTHALCTHHHIDHVENNDLYRQRCGCQVCGHTAERELFGGLDRELADGEELAVGKLRIRALHIPGHTKGQLAFLVNEQKVFTGDTLFKDSVGGTRGPGHTTYEDLHTSIMDVLMKLPPETEVCPGHTVPTTIAQEWEHNPFVRLWRGLEQPVNKRCTAFGQPATLRLRAKDYDGGTKCWVRFDEGQREDVVPGSRVQETE